MATFNNGESLSSVRTKINDAIDKIDGNATISNNIDVSGTLTIDTINETTAAAGVTIDSVLLKDGGATFTSDVSFGDNDKAIFGAGSDLQIYHDGSNSFIDEAGTGNLRIRASSALNLQTRNTADTAWVNSIIADDGAGVRLFTNGSKKLETTSTGIDVTGTVTADGLTVDGEATFGTATGVFPDEAIFVRGNNGTSGYINGLGVGNSNAQFRIFADDTNNTAGSIKFDIRNRDRVLIEDNGDISFYEDTGTTAKFFWDASAESLGIGTSSPSAPLTVQTSATTNVDIKTSATNGTAQLRFSNDARTYSLGIDNNDSFFVYDATGTSTRMTIDSSGNVGIGTSSPSGLLELKTTTSNAYLYITADNASSSRVYLGDEDNATIGRIGYNHGFNFMDFYTNGSERMRIDSSGNVGIGTSSPSAPLHLLGNNTAILIQDDNDDVLRLTSGAAGSYIQSGASLTSGSSNPLIFGSIYNANEWMRIDSSGNLLVGTTNSTPHNLTSGGGLSVRGSINLFSIARQDNEVMIVNRTGTDGDIALFRKDGTTVGSIGSEGSGARLYINQGDTGIGMQSSIDSVIPVSANGGARNNAIDLGYSTVRWKDLYLSGGVYLGGTGAANKLDDYEEGTWTPVVKGNTTAGTANYLYRDASYAKVGNMVHVSCTIFANSFTGTGDFRVSGLPFTYNGTAIFAAQWNNSPFATYSSDKQQVVGLGTAGTEIHFRASDRQYNVSHTQLQCQGGSATVGYLRLSGTYHV